MKNRKVDFLIIGAQKAGTTSLYRYLLQHPDICFSDVKEVNYFVLDRLYAKGESYYHSYFSRCRDQKAVGGVYVHMLPCAKCPERVRAYNPDMKFIVVLRDPVERAYSAYRYALRNGWEAPANGFSDCIALEAERVRREQYDLAYFHNGLYHRHLTRWMTHFPRDRFLLIRLQDLEADPLHEVGRAGSFLGVPPVAVNVSQRYNEASDVHSSRLQGMLLRKRQTEGVLQRWVPQRAKVFIRSRIFPWIFRFNKRPAAPPPPMTEAERQAVSPLFREDLERLQADFGISFDA